AHIQGIFHSFYPFYSGFIRDRTPSQRKALCDEVTALIAEHVTGETAERLTAATEHLLIGDPPTETRRVHRALDQILRPEPLLDEPLRSLTGVLPVRGRVIFFYIFVCIHR
ncbi:MAG: hypothetical protein ACOCV0_06440, partial [Alkalispirochaeta sp.]